MNSRSVSDGGIFSQSGAKGGDLLSHLFQFNVPSGHSIGIEHHLESLRSIQREDLKEGKPRTYPVSSLKLIKRHELIFFFCLYLYSNKKQKMIPKQRILNISG